MDDLDLVRPVLRTVVRELERGEDVLLALQPFPGDEQGGGKRVCGRHDAGMQPGDHVPGAPAGLHGVVHRGAPFREHRAALGVDERRAVLAHLLAEAERAVGPAQRRAVGAAQGDLHQHLIELVDQFRPQARKLDRPEVATVGAVRIRTRAEGN
jgi:hypothetical protein